MLGRFILMVYWKVDLKNKMFPLCESSVQNIMHIFRCLLNNPSVNPHRDKEKYFKIKMITSISGKQWKMFHVKSQNMKQTGKTLSRYDHNALDLYANGLKHSSFILIEVV